MTEGKKGASQAQRRAGCEKSVTRKEVLVCRDIGKTGIRINSKIDLGEHFERSGECPRPVSNLTYGGRGTIKTEY